MNTEFIQVKDLDQLHGETPTYLAVGVFDGVHLGHQRLIKAMIAEAKDVGARSAVLTFHPHPAKVINGRSGRIYLSSVDERTRCLAQLGLPLVITKEFDEEFRRTRAADFVDLLIKRVNLVQLWGGNFGLGYQREGDYDFLSKLGEERGFTVHLFQEIVEWRDDAVSSSRIRHALARGDIEDANGCLGRRYSLSGEVVHGDGRGKHIGIPTANLDIWDELILPANGVYAASASVNSVEYPAAVNIGIRPTVNGHSLNVEAHLLDFDRVIYGEELTIEFLARLRDEQKFPSLDALVVQIESDIEMVRSLLPAPVKQK